MPAERGTEAGPAERGHGLALLNGGQKLAPGPSRSLSSAGLASMKQQTCYRSQLQPSHLVSISELAEQFPLIGPPAVPKTPLPAPAARAPLALPAPG